MANTPVVALREGQSLPAYSDAVPNARYVETAKLMAPAFAEPMSEHQKKKGSKGRCVALFAIIVAGLVLITAFTRQCFTIGKEIQDVVDVHDVNDITG